MSNSVDDPHCPECGEPIGQTATYCMHCSADLSGRAPVGGSSDSWGSEPAEPESDDSWGSEPADSESGDTSNPSESEKPEYMRDSAEGTSETGSDQILDPEGLADNALTVVAGIVAGIIIGILVSIFGVAATSSGWGFLFGFLAWAGSTGYLARRYTVQEAIAHGLFGIAIIFVLLPFVAFSPFAPIDQGIDQRIAIFISWGIVAGFFAVPAGLLGGIVYYFVPDQSGDEQSYAT